MKASRRTMATVIGDRLNAGEKPEKLAREVAAYLLSEKRVDELDPLMRDVIEYRATKGIVEATATSAHELDARTIQELEAYIKALHPGAKRRVINKRLNKTLIGGLKLNVINDQLDLSIRAKLNKFKELSNQRGV